MITIARGRIHRHEGKTDFSARLIRSLRAGLLVVTLLSAGSLIIITYLLDHYLQKDGTGQKGGRNPGS